MEAENAIEQQRKKTTLTSHMTADLCIGADESQQVGEGLIGQTNQMGWQVDLNSTAARVAGLLEEQQSITVSPHRPLARIGVLAAGGARNQRLVHSTRSGKRSA